MKVKINRMNFFKFLLLVMAILIIILIIIKVFSKNNMNKKEDDSGNTVIDKGVVYEKDPYVNIKDMYMGGNAGGINIENLENAREENGEKINTSEKILQSREFEALEITNIILKSNIGNTEFIANVLNKSKSNFKSKNLVIKFLNSTGKEIGKMQISIPDLVADGETIVDASITEDYVNAYDIIIENVK